jgi:hypothetical protein
VSIGRSSRLEKLLTDFGENKKPGRTTVDDLSVSGFGGVISGRRRAVGEDWCSDWGSGSRVCGETRPAGKRKAREYMDSVSRRKHIGSLGRALSSGKWMGELGLPAPRPLPAQTALSAVRVSC